MSYATLFKEIQLIKIKVILILLLISISTLGVSYGQTLEVSANNRVFKSGQPFFVYGKSLPNEDIIVRLFSPDGTISKFEQIKADSEGSFSIILITWPEVSPSFPYGTYTAEVISTKQNGLSYSIDVRFTSSTDLVEVPVERQIMTMVFAPETAAINVPIRIFAQTTSDGLLVGGDPKDLLQTSHVHLPNGKVETVSDSFQALHQGLYYVDYTPRMEGTYVFHVVTFSQGTISHGSAATVVLSQDIGGISKQIIELNSILNETSSELDVLQSEIEGFGNTLEGASKNIDSSVTSISSSVGNIEEASVQLNSLFFPIVASIGIIVALQIAILARRR